MKKTNPIIEVSCASFLVFAFNIGLAADQSSYSALEVDFEWHRFKVNLNAPDGVFVYSPDINADGYSDLVLTGLTSQTAERRGGNEGLILFNTGDNKFVVADGDRPSTEWTGDVEAADFNGDGIGDVFIADSGFDAPPFPGFQNSLFLGTGTGFVNATSQLPQLEGFSHRSDVADIDKDGDIDILVTNIDAIQEELSYFLINDGNANFTLDRSRLPDSLSVLANLEVSLTLKLVDLDGDGNKDLIAGKEFDQFPSPPTRTRVFWNDGNGFFSDSSVTKLPDMEQFTPDGGYSVIDIQPIDMEFDGDQDIILTAYDSAFRGVALQLYQNLGARQLIDSSSSCLTGPFQELNPNIAGPDYLQILDVDGDGQSEIVSHGISFIENLQDIILMEKLPTGGFTSILSGEMTSDSQALPRLGLTPIKGNGVFGYVEVFLDQGDVNIRYIPVEITPTPPIINFFDFCTNRLSLAFDGGDFGLLEIDFKLLQTVPTILVQADLNNMRKLDSSVGGLGSIDLSTYTISIPELRSRGELVASGLKLELRDGDAFIYEITQFEQ